MAEVAMDKSAPEVDEKEALKDVMNNIYAQQHFDTTARQLTNDIFNESITQFLNQMPTLRESLLKAATTGKNDEQTEVISSEMDSKLAKLAIEFYALLEKNADALEMYLYRHILTIPPGKVLHQDKVQLRSKEVIDKMARDDTSNCGSASSDAVLIPNLDEKRRELLQRKCDKMRLQFEIELADKTLQRLKSLENSIDSAMSNFDGSLKDFVLTNLAAVKTLPKLSEVLSK